ncbi:hypothetical protein CPC08DRAFT_356752 [Agrocybe pediades]|nr:hypothetical protein CPC08DRAFT_356752 [Agrocybe pediades]
MILAMASSSSLLALPYPSGAFLSVAHVVPLHFLSKHNAVAPSRENDRGEYRRLQPFYSALRDEMMHPLHSDTISSVNRWSTVNSLYTNGPSDGWFWKRFSSVTEQSDVRPSSASCERNSVKA